MKGRGYDLRSRYVRIYSSADTSYIRRLESRMYGIGAPRIVYLGISALRSFFKPQQLVKSSRNPVEKAPEKEKYFK